MGRPEKLLERIRRAARPGDDRGVTLAELAVTTGIMSIVMAIFTTAVVQLFQASDKSELVATTQAQLTNAFLRLDRELRYAAGFGPVRTDTSGNVFVEYVNTGTASGTPECAQLELYKNAKTLRRQVWPQQTGQKPVNTWTVLASNVNVDKSSFTILKSTENTTFQRLRVVLVVESNPGRGHTEALSDVTFTALNSKASTDANTICPEARS
ncbi:PilW family protein [Dactylosporangium sp. CA-233914]|uniref:PilW family protein n=1 Tax=Dactylosporangium sp. CA-233914 TaxID=3239934 RepID=UPI003D9391DD